MKCLTGNEWNTQLIAIPKPIDPMEFRCDEIMSACGEPPILPPFLRNK